MKSFSFNQKGGGYEIGLDQPSDCPLSAICLCVTFALFTTEKRIISIVIGVYFIMRTTLQTLLKYNHDSNKVFQ